MNENSNESKTPTFSEKYGLATVSRSLRLDENKRGAVNLLIASAVASRSTKNKSENFLKSFGGDLTRLQAEWDQAAKPKKMLVPSLKECLRLLPLVRVGERLNYFKELVPIMGRNKLDAKKFRTEQQKISDTSYHCEIIMLAQKLPSRVKVRETLFEFAPRTDLKDRSFLIASVITYWLTSRCHTCNGTKLLTIGNKVKACHDCKGSSKITAPGFEDGQRILSFMDQSQSSWADSVKSTYKIIHK